MFNSVFIIKIILISLVVISIYFLFKKNYFGIGLKVFVDNNFHKPQSFHKKPIPSIGGLMLLIFFLISFFIFYKNSVLRELSLIIIIFFFSSILEDLKIKISPQYRLLIQFFIILLIVIFYDLKIQSIQFYSFDNLLKSNNNFSLIFTSLAILFVINGSNFIDGFNGLLGFHALIIASFLIPIFFSFNQYDLLETSILFINFLIIFLFFNFPNAKIFLGNNGSYLVGLIISFLVIKASEITSYHKFYPFYFAILIYYLFFEVFFSFFRKILYERKNPLLPDKKHLHMLLYYKIKSNPVTSFLINIFFLVSILPVLFLKNYPGFLKGYFFLLIFIYISFYFSLLKKK